jgi:hypothetical protein
MIPSLIVAGIGMGCVVASVYPFILARVNIKDAGSASGVINAVGQIGGAIGIAVIGVIFFGALAGGSLPSVESVRSDLTSDLAAAGIPAPAVPAIVTSFETCFQDRASAKDFAAMPESCRNAEADAAAFAAANPEIAAQLTAIVSVRAKEANQRNFSAALERTMLWQIAGLVLIALLSLALPRHPRSEAELAEAGIAPA